MGLMCQGRLLEQQHDSVIVTRHGLAKAASASPCLVHPPGKDVSLQGSRKPMRNMGFLSKQQSCRGNISCPYYLDSTLLWWEINGIKNKINKNIFQPNIVLKTFIVLHFKSYINGLRPVLSVPLEWKHRLTRLELFYSPALLSIGIQKDCSQQNAPPIPFFCHVNQNRSVFPEDKCPPFAFKWLEHDLSLINYTPCCLSPLSAPLANG